MNDVLVPMSAAALKRQTHSAAAEWSRLYTGQTMHHMQRRRPRRVPWYWLAITGLSLMAALGAIYFIISWSF